MSRLRVQKKVEGDTIVTDVPSWPKGYSILYDVMLTNKIWGKARIRWDIHGYGICFPRWPLHSEVWLSKCLDICLPMGISKLILCFASLVHASLLPFLYFLNLNPQVFLSFDLPILSPILLRENEQVMGWRLSCQLRSMHNTYLEATGQMQWKNSWNKVYYFKRDQHLGFCEHSFLCRQSH